MNIIPYQSIDGFHFGESTDAAQAKFGVPERIDQSRGGQRQLHYPKFILRFNSHTDLFQEFTALYGCELSLNGKPVAWDIRFLQEMRQTDAEMIVSYGFVLSFKYGLSISGFHDADETSKAIHIFREGLWAVEPDDEVQPFVA